MDQRTSTEWEETADRTTEDLPSTWEEEENPRHYKNSLGFRRHWWPLAFWCVSFPVLFVFSPLLLGCGDKHITEDLNSIKRRLDRVEIKLALLEGTRQRIPRLEGEIIKLRQSFEKLNRSVGSNDQIPQKKAKSPARMDYHVVRPGEVLSGIAMRYGMSLYELCRLNQITPKTIIRPGQKILVIPAGKQ